MIEQCPHCFNAFIGSNTESPTNFAFIDESGVLDGSLHEQPYFGVGLLKIADTSLIGEKLSLNHYDYFSSQKHNRRQLLKSLRENPRLLDAEGLNLLFKATSHHEYKFTHITYTTLDKYKAFIDTAFTFPLHFSALVIDKTDPMFDLTIYKNYWAAYITYSRLLCRNNCDPDEKLCVIADYMNRPNADDSFFEVEVSKLDAVANAIRAHSETFMLLQLTDLLLGSVLFQWREKNGYVNKSNRAKAKQEFVDYVVAKLKVNSRDYPLAAKLTIRSPFYFNVWPLKLQKTTKGEGV